MRFRFDQSVAVSLALGLFAFALDRGHKLLAIEVFHGQGGDYTPLTSFFDYVLVWNTGISYGLLSTLPVTLLSVIMVVAIVALCAWWYRTRSPLVRSGLALCIGGALSNATDRWLYGAVADFFHFHWQQYSFYIFNIADMAITLGVGLLMLDLLGVGRPKTERTESVDRQIG